MSYLKNYFLIQANKDERTYPNIFLVNEDSKLDEININHTYINHGKMTYYKSRSDQERDLVIVDTEVDLPTYKYRALGGNVYHYLNKLSFTYITINIKQTGLKDDEIQSFIEGFILRANKLDTYKHEKCQNSISTINFVVDEAVNIKSIYEKAEMTARSVFLARFITNEPANRFNADTFVNAVRNRFEDESNVKIKIYQGQDLVRNNMVGLLNLSKGSLANPALIEIGYQTDPLKPLITLVGKGITIDTGGYNIKSGKDISGIRVDMGGAAAVFGALDLLIKMRAKVNVVGIIVTTENLINSEALVPGDVIVYPNNISVQVANTDAEGRLILADGLIHAQNLGSEVVIDIATLTGSVGMALGNELAGLWGNESIVKELKSSAEATGEHVWHMPLVEAYENSLNSDYADLKNISSMSLGGAITAALFLKKFVNDCKWAHLDIAAMVESNRDEDEFVKGTTGYGVRLLTEFVKKYK